MSKSRRLDDLLHDVVSGARAPAIMGVVNVTPDSFSDGGRFIEPGAAVEHAARMVAEGADLIDVGPESTRPGSDAVSTTDQIARAVPVIAAIRAAHADVLLSMDTQSAEVARAAIDAGADLANDVSALRTDGQMGELIAERGAGVVLMHMRGMPRTMQTAGGGPVYDDVVGEIVDFLRDRIEFAIGCGISRQRIIADPGLGFGKTAEHNLTLLRRLSAFASLGVPLMVGASRKSFVGRVTGVEVAADRLAGSLACVTAAVLGGASILRVHDVRASREAVAMAYAIRRERGA
ncbi:MAG TPA: dihydropteroate synthase [Phycisphaerae bacterium]|nr:dihydropteroate synthase [Phycisphaerae bacterium]